MNVPIPSILLENKRSWPIQPYKGLDYYEVLDAPLFAGRARDVRDCAGRLAAPAVRALVLQGNTGCGKSSFLRAGLIPYLESQTVGFSFPHEHGNPMRALFVRSTQSPLSGLAVAIHTFASERMRKANARMRDGLVLGTCGIEDPQRFVTAIGNDIFKLRECLGCIADVVPETLVLVIDQLEEVLTLNPGPNGDLDRDAFFDFLTLLEEKPADVKLLLSMRTEYFGKIFDRLQRSVEEPGTIDQYLLNELSEDAMVEAIERPTLDRPVGPLPAPHGVYRFRFEEGLPQAIVKDLKEAVPIDGILPVLQIVCGRLFFSTASATGEDVTITAETYHRFGGVRGQLYRYLVEGTLALCVDRGLSFRKAYVESERWRGLILGLARFQADSSVVSDIVSEGELAERVSAARCRIPFDRGVKALSNGEPRLLRRMTIPDGSGTGTIPAYALGHDAIGLASLTSERIQARADELLYKKLRWQGIIQTGVLACLLIVINVVVALLFTRGVHLTWLQYALLYLPIVYCIATSVALIFNLPTQRAMVYVVKKLAPSSVASFGDLEATSASQYEVAKEIFARLTSEQTRRRQLRSKKQLFDAESGPDLEWDEAVTDARTLIRSGQADFAIYINLARGQRRRGQIEAAISTLSDGVSKAEISLSHADKNLPVLYYNRACYLALRYADSPSDTTYQLVLDDIKKCLAHSSSPLAEIEDMRKDPDLDAVANTPGFIKSVEPFLAKPSRRH